ncbi:MAG TPA: cell division protein FtsQ [Rhodospirillaceae bacterium]|nr:cell division protein FtsQ [Rhodospirillaceae bacterium]HAT35899.1 cell division protein FtsQ [Rhodospirillaceae bacterium]
MKAEKNRNPGKSAENSRSARLRRALMVRLKAKPMLFAIAGLVLIIACGAGGVVIHLTGAEKSVAATIDRFNRSIADSVGLTVDEVLVTGRIETPRSKLLEALKVKRGDPIFGFDPHEARKRLLAIGWVAEADVQRRLPNTIYVRLTEQKPAAIWQHNGKFKLISRDGGVISNQVSQRYKNLKILVGEDAPTNAAGLMTMLESERELMVLVTHATRVGARRWNLLLRQGIDIRLPAERAEKAWRYLAELQRKHRILQQRIRAVDLRVPDRLTVQILKTPDAKRVGDET